MDQMETREIGDNELDNVAGGIDQLGFLYSNPVYLTPDNGWASVYQQAENPTTMLWPSGL